MRESGRRSQLLELLKPLHAVAIENSLGDGGTPDLNCTAGWIEIKQLPSWPIRPDTVVRPPHFEPEQRHFLRTRCSQGGNAWMMLVVGNTWNLVWGLSAAVHVGVDWVTADYQLAANDRMHWSTKPDVGSLIRALMLRRWG
jgi:hypothetical protein